MSKIFYVDQLEELRRIAREEIRKYYEDELKKLSPMGCSVCGIGFRGEPLGYVCNRADCPTRVRFERK